MRWLIHRLHTGEELTVDFTVYGYRSSIHNYNELVYPGDLRTCETCHIGGSYNVPAPEGSHEVTTERSYLLADPAGRRRLSGLPQHGRRGGPRLYVNTAPFGESCASCHGADREFSVDAVHAH